MLLAVLCLQAVILDPGRPPPVHDVLHYDVTVSLPDSGRTITGIARSTWVLESRASLTVDLDSAFVIERADLDGREATFERRGNTLTFPTPGEAGDTIRLGLWYHGLVSDGLIIAGEGDASTVFADNWPNRAHRWFPGHDHPRDKATITFHVTAPTRYAVIANGVLTGRGSAVGGRRRWTYTLAQPTPMYTMVVGAARFARRDLPPAGCAVRCVPLAVWAYPEDSASAMAGPFHRAGSMIDFLSELAGPFPYDRLTHVQSTTQFGGMENSSVIFYNAEAIHQGRMGEETVAHETAHQWFGDAVTPVRWRDLWLSEGFATYFAALWVGWADGDTAFRRSMDRSRERIFASDATREPILADSLPDNLLQLLNTNAYQKGAWTLHELRGVVGDHAFFEGIRTYVERFRHSTASSADLRAVMEGVARRDLGWFFRQALEQSGFPTLQITAARGPGRGQVTLVVHQRQPAADGWYRLPGLIVSLDGRRFAVDVAAAAATRVVLDGVKDLPREITVDPDGWWLLQASGTERP